MHKFIVRLLDAKVTPVVSSAHLVRLIAGDSIPQHNAETVQARLDAANGKGKSK